MADGAQIFSKLIGISYISGVAKARDFKFGVYIDYEE